MTTDTPDYGPCDYCGAPAVGRTHARGQRCTAFCSDHRDEALTAWADTVLGGLQP